jgi:hypothetical protein
MKELCLYVQFLQPSQPWLTSERLLNQLCGYPHCHTSVGCFLEFGLRTSELLWGLKTLLSFIREGSQYFPEYGAIC